MKILFLTIGQIQGLKEKSVHLDLINSLKNAGHDISVLCTREKRLALPTECVMENKIKIARIKIGNLTKCGFLEKGISTILIEGQFKRAVKKYFSDSEFDLIIYATPPITLARVVEYCKKRYNAKSYLMLKDIFPQNAVDIGMMSKGGISGIMYKMFRKKEVRLYKASDKIGCMSNANVEYLLENNSYISRANVEIFQNAVNVSELKTKDKSALQKYGIDVNKTIFIYGGNLGKPQGLDFLAKGIEKVKDNINAHFIIIGSGSEKDNLFNTVKNYKNVTTLDYLPSAEYLSLAQNCDVGLVMLDYRFTIPNYPSRILSYMENAIPVFACTDNATDIKQLVLDEANCGKWCYSDSLEDFASMVTWFTRNTDKLSELGQNGRKYLEKNFNVEICVQKLEDFMNGNKEKETNV